MINKLFCVGCIGIILVLSGCSKGIDRKLDFSGSAEEIGASYGAAILEATPEQQNVMRIRFDGIASYISLLLQYSNPIVTEAVVASRNAEELEIITKMTVGEIIVRYLERDQRYFEAAIPAVSQFVEGAGLHLESVIVDKISPPQITNETSSVAITGKLLLKNTSADFDIDVRGCHLAIAIDGQKTEEPAKSYDCLGSVLIPAGLVMEVAYQLRLNGKEKVRAFGDNLQTNEVEKIEWLFALSEDSYVRDEEKGEVYEASTRKLAMIKQQLKEVEADIATMQK